MSVNNCADSMLSRIQDSITNTVQSMPALRTAIVESVNQNGTVNIRIPESSTIFSGISNQTPFILNPGDTVEVMLKTGNNWSNVWIVAKHQDTMDIKSLIKECVYEILRENGVI